MRRMEAVDRIVDEARALSPAELRRLRDAIDELAAETAEQERLAAFDAFLSLGGTCHSDHHDVSANKHAHLADIYADKHE